MTEREKAIEKIMRLKKRPSIGSRVKRIGAILVICGMLLVSSGCVTVLINLGALAASELAIQSGTADKVFPKNQPPAKQSPQQGR